MRYFIVLLIVFLAACDSGTGPDLDPLPPEDDGGQVDNDDDPSDDTDDAPDDDVAVITDFIIDPPQADSLEVIPVQRIGDNGAGHQAFRLHCGGCHASPDGFDLAFFNFADADIIRRGVAHVDTATVLEIRDYIRSVGDQITQVDRETQLFRPGNEHIQGFGESIGDIEFARRLFGEDRWPQQLTVDELLGIDPRDIALSVPLPTWSSEANENDWMPEAPLPDEVLSAQGGAVQQHLDAYYDAPSQHTLKDLVDTFEQVATQPGAVCEGQPGFHPLPEACFEARRWMSSLTAMHLIQTGVTRTVPEYMADLWWRVGEAAVSWSLDRTSIGRAERLQRRRVANSWLMLSWIYDPVRLGDNTAYFSEFMKHTDERRQAALAYAYWLIKEPGANDGGQLFDVMNQMLIPERLPEHWYFDYVYWMQEAVDQFMDAGFVPQTNEAFDLAVWVLQNADRDINDSAATATEKATLRARMRALEEKVRASR